MTLTFSSVLCLGTEAKAHFSCHIHILPFSYSVPGDCYEVLNYSYIKYVFGIALAP